MPRFIIPFARDFAIAGSVFAALVLLAITPETQSQTNGPAAETPIQSEAPVQLKVSSNLVLVRVVVRDPAGKPIANLHKEDFRLVDQGKEQTIAQFDVQTSTLPPSGSATAPTPEHTSRAPAMLSNFIALYFDDLNSSDPDMMQARDAADHYLAANLRPNGRIAIFTSEDVLSDFDSDPKQIHDALSKLHVSARSLTKAQYCPDLSDFQALQITQNDEDALAVATDEAAHCDGGVLVPPSGTGGQASNGVGPASRRRPRRRSQSISNRWRRRRRDCRGGGSNPGPEYCEPVPRAGAHQLATTRSSGEAPLANAGTANAHTGFSRLPFAE